MDKMRIEIWSDIACPYCYIGKRKLDRALAKFEHKDKVEIVWYSYELSPTLAKEPSPKSMVEFDAKMHGIAIEEAQRGLDEITELAAEVGIKYNLKNLVITNTHDALRLVKLAAKSKLATEAEEALFKAYFTDGECISSKNVLLKIGVSIGLDKEDVISLLEGDEFSEKVKTDGERAEEKFNLEYIPFYRFNYNQIIQGSIPEEDYLKVLEQAYSDWENGTTSEGETITGKSCSIDGVCS